VAQLTREQAREIDRIAMEELRIPGIVLMENAARGIAEAILRRFPAPRGPIAVVCGPGNNGGDGLAAARHLSNAGLDVRIHLVTRVEASRPASDAGTNLRIVRAMGLPVLENMALDGAAVLVDAIFGTGLSRAVRAPYRAAIAAVRRSKAKVVAVDLPSGLDADTGKVLGVAVRADLTATMVAPKIGFTLGEGPSLVGEVVVVDIGVPPSVLRRVTGG
jgi:NAD(P)H-hydrate epimerase